MTTLNEKLQQNNETIKTLLKMSEDFEAGLKDSGTHKEDALWLDADEQAYRIIREIKKLNSIILDIQEA